MRQIFVLIKLGFRPFNGEIIFLLFEILLAQLCLDFLQSFQSLLLEFFNNIWLINRSLDILVIFMLLFFFIFFSLKIELFLTLRTKMIRIFNDPLS